MQINKKHINVFIAYARKDTTYLDELRVHLRPLHRNKTIQIWYDGEIVPGTLWEEQIKTHLHAADIILLLVSANSLASDYFHDKEMKDALERHEKEETIVIPVILSACIWDFTNLKDLQALPANGKAVDEWIKSSKAYDSVVRGLYKSIEVIQNRKQEEAKATELEQQKKIAAENKKAEAAQEKPLIILRSGLVTQARNRTSYMDLVHEGNALFLQDEFAAAKEKYEASLSFNSNGKEAENGIHKCELFLIPKITPSKEANFSKKFTSFLPPVQAIVDNMIAVNGGTFQMGDAEIAPPVHAVTLSDFHISKYQITQEQWRAVMESDPPKLEFKGCNQCPVESVSWDDTQDFIKRLNSLTGKRFRLPTEAEWEYAARGGKKSEGYQYAGSNTLDDVAWYGKKNSDKNTHPVGLKKSNELGLYDMSGNVWEWCSDLYGKNYYSKSPSTNPKGDTSGTTRVFRGGSWNYYNNSCRVSYRNGGNSNSYSSSNGFRVVQD